jgi:hypothetical protein
MSLELVCRSGKPGNSVFQWNDKFEGGLRIAAAGDYVENRSIVLTTNLEDSQFGMHTNLVANQFESGVDLPMKEA